MSPRKPRPVSPTTSPTPLVPVCQACLDNAPQGTAPDFPHRVAAPGERCEAADHADVMQGLLADTVDDIAALTALEKIGPLTDSVRYALIAQLVSYNDAVELRHAFRNRGPSPIGRALLAACERHDRNRPNPTPGSRHAIPRKP